MKSADAVNEVVSLDHSDVSELRAKISGPISVPGEDEFAAELSGFELSVVHRPAVAVAAAGAADVAAAVRFAQARGLPVAVQATGHGASVPATGVFISTRRMSGVAVDPDAQTVRVDAGARWDHIIPRAAAHRLAPLSGSAPFVGAVSYTLGGGLGLLSRRYGYAADHVLDFDLVTADGQLIHVTPDEQSDLFWGVRGSKGNLGIVTSMRMRLFGVERLYGGGLFFPGESARNVLADYFGWIRTIPDELSSSIFLVRFPDAAALPEPLRDRFVVHIRLAHLGGAAEAEQLIQPLRAAGPVLLDTLAEIPYRDSHTIHADPPDPVASHSKVAMLRGLDSDAAGVIAEMVGPDAHAPFGFELRHMGGALARPAASPSAISHFPDAEFSAYIGSIVEPGALAAVEIAQQRMLNALKPWHTGRTTLNFMAGANTAVDTVRTAYAAVDYARLAELKKRYDPDNMFRFNPNVPPAG